MTQSNALSLRRSFIDSSHRRLFLDPPAVMGVLNVTPDSFSDGGLYLSVDAALQRADAMIEAGATIIDVGGESTRPGATPVSTDSERARVLPVIEALRRAYPDLFISLDTSNPVVMRDGASAGCDMINDVRGLEARGALEIVAETGVAVCVMHHHGEPPVMQRRPQYSDVVGEVSGYLHDRVLACRAVGVPVSRIVIDPGFGFGKTLNHNLALMRSIGDLSVEGCPILMGVSRKSMFAKLFGRDELDSRIHGSLGAAFWAASQGVGIIRCHDVRATAEILCLASALMGAGEHKRPDLTR